MISIVIPVYKKADEFLKNLEHNFRFLKDCEVIVVNDDPEESIRERLKKYRIKLIENEKNLGFSGAVNIGVNQTKHDLVFLLNSDVLLYDDSFKSSERKFEKDKMLFALTFAQKEKDGSLVGKNKLFWKGGLIQHSKAYDLNEGETGWAEGGSTIVRKDMFLELDGFDTMFYPFYWEDIDLSYRAKKKGYTVIFDPSVIVEHHHESTIGTYWKAQSIQIISYRNQILCSWKHIEDTNFISHLLFLISYLIRSMVKGDFVFIQGFLKAVPFLFSAKFNKIK